MLMRILVSEMPSAPITCAFGQYDARYDVVECQLSEHKCQECVDVGECDYLKVF